MATFKIWDKFFEKGYFWCITNEMNIIKFRIFEIDKVPNLTLNKKILNFWTNFAQKGYLTFKIKSEY